MKAPLSRMEESTFPFYERRQATSLRCSRVRRATFVHRPISMWMLPLLVDGLQLCYGIDRDE